MNDFRIGRPLDQLQSGGWGIIDGRATFTKFVPDITKVPVNRVTMTIDSFSFTRFGSNASIGGGHTIRIYGVPEPASCSSLLHRVNWCLIRRFATHNCLAHFDSYPIQVIL